jgi:flagella basal body P-ring formation protein FlgA
MRRFLLPIALLAGSASLSARAGSGADAVPGASPVDRAIVAAIRQRMGADVEVIVDSVRILTRAGSDVVCPSGACRAVPDPSATLGAPMRFALVGTTYAGVAFARAPRTVRLATVEASVRVTASVVRAREIIARGETVAPDQIGAVRDEIARLPLRRLPDLVEIVGGRALRDVAPGEPLTSSSVVVAAAVRSGQNVTAVSRVQGIEASTTLVAAQRGSTGDIIRVVNRDSGRTLRARVLSPSLVEIIP